MCVSVCVCVRAQPCVRDGGLSDDGPIRSSGVLCIVIAASGCFLSLCVCVGVLLVVMIVSVLTWIIFADIKSYRRHYEVRLGTL